MVLIETINSKRIEVQPNKNLYKEFMDAKNAIDELTTHGDQVKFLSIQRRIKTINERQQGMMKELSLPDELSFWSEPLNRKHTEHRVWFKSNSLDKIFLSYTMLLEKLREVE